MEGIALAGQRENGQVEYAREWRGGGEFSSERGGGDFDECSLRRVATNYSHNGRCIVQCCKREKCERSGAKEKEEERRL